MSVKVHEAFSIDSFQDRLLWWDDFLGDQLKDEWNSTIAAAGTTDVVDAQTGGIVRLTTGALDTNNNILDWQDIRSLHVDQKVSMEVRVKLTHLTQQYIELALRFDVNNYIMFWNGPGGAATNWFTYCNDGGASTSQDSGILADTDYHIFRIEAFPTGEVHFYIDGVETANSPITTNIPDDVTDYLQPHIMIVTRENAAKSMDIDYVVVRQEI